MKKDMTKKESFFQHIGDAHITEFVDGQRVSNRRQIERQS